MPSLNSGKILKDKSTKYANHTLYYPFVQGNPRRNLPSSPRNRLMFFTLDVAKSDHLGDLVRHLLHVEKGDQYPETGDEVDTAEPPRKRRKHALRLVAVNPQKVCEEAKLNLNEILNSTKRNRPMYTTFQEQLIAEGSIKWRLHEPGKDICMMNNINSSTGVLLPGSFVHVTCLRANSQEEPILSCTCEIFNLILRASKQDVALVPGEEEGIPDSSFTCMHCRFFRDHLLGAYIKVQRGNVALSRPLTMVKESLADMNTDVQLLGEAFPTGTTKFSVKGEDRYSVVHFSFYQGKCFTKCMDGLCAAALQNKKKIPKKMSLSHKKSLCSHLRTVLENFDAVKNCFPEYFNNEEEEEEGVNAEPLDDVNTDDFNLTNGGSGNFDRDTGLWKFPSFSRHKPYTEMNSPELVEHTQHRNDLICSRSMNQQTGLYSYLALLPSGEDKTCECGAGFVGTHPVQIGTATLYTRLGPLECRYYDLPCRTGTCKLSYEEAAKEKGIFFWSGVTAAGDEIGWDFIHQVKSSKISFTAFCNEMTRKYQTNNIFAAPFMSRKTFVNWLFGWLSAFEIDFRQTVDPWCKYSPKMLACDGTHIGISLKNLRVENPITAVDDEDRTLPSKHKRYDRVIISDKPARHHLRYLCKKYLKKLKQEEVLEYEEESTLTAYLLEFVDSMAENELSEMIYMFAQHNQDEELIVCAARVLYMLSGDAPMSSVVPFMSHGLLHHCIRDVRQGKAVTKHMEEMRTYGMDIVDLLQASVKHECVDVVTKFLEFIILRIELIHSTNRPAPEAREIPDSYNPPSGTAYYFTESGNQVRRMPTYQVSGNSKKANYDDAPEIEAGCTKMFPKISYGGYGYMFLWFCPIHGHSYGFHLIEGGEGRKDPFCSLYKYLDTPPDHIYYDFACQLSEYCLNREPELFKNTRFWHDLFHALGHVCGPNFKSGRVVGLEGVNSEICEQVNAFLQCVKFTASHLSQDHFIFFLQFFLYILNQEKTKKFRQQASVAVAGHL